MGQRFIEIVENRIPHIVIDLRGTVTIEVPANIHIMPTCGPLHRI